MVCAQSEAHRSRQATIPSRPSSTRRWREPKRGNCPDSVRVENSPSEMTKIGHNRPFDMATQIVDNRSLSSHVVRMSRWIAGHLVSTTQLASPSRLHSQKQESRTSVARAEIWVRHGFGISFQRFKMVKFLLPLPWGSVQGSLCNFHYQTRTPSLVIAGPHSLSIKSASEHRASARGLPANAYLLGHIPGGRSGLVLILREDSDRPSYGLQLNRQSGEGLSALPSTPQLSESFAKSATSA